MSVSDVKNVVVTFFNSILFGFSFAQVFKNLHLFIQLKYFIRVSSILAFLA